MSFFHSVTFHSHIETLATCISHAFYHLIVYFTITTGATDIWGRCYNGKKSLTTSRPVVWHMNSDSHEQKEHTFATRQSVAWRNIFTIFKITFILNLPPMRVIRLQSISNSLHLQLAFQSTAFRDEICISVWSTLHYTEPGQEINIKEISKNTYFSFIGHRQVHLHLLAC